MKQAELNFIADHLDNLASKIDHSYDEGIMYAEGIRFAGRVLRENCGSIVDEHSECQ